MVAGDKICFNFSKKGNVSFYFLTKKETYIPFRAFFIRMFPVTRIKAHRRKGAGGTLHGWVVQEGTSHRIKIISLGS